MVCLILLWKKKSRLDKPKHINCHANGESQGICNSHFYLVEMQELLDDTISEEQHIYMKRNRMLIRAMLMQLGIALLATMLAIYDIVTIVGAGPVGSIMGLIVFWFAYQLDFSRRKKIGLSAPIFSALCFSLIYFLAWSKVEAYIPIITLMAFYTIGLSIVIRIEIKRDSKKNFEWDEEILHVP